MNPRLLCSRLASCFTLALVATTAYAQCTYFLPQATHEAHARWGTSVAMSGNGHLALVGGPGADGSDGIVRTFAWNGSSWIEQNPLFPEPLYAYAAGFGWSVALSYDGQTAVIGAPGDQHAEFIVNQGAVYVFTRNPGTGQWSQQARLVKPNPSGQQSFGQAVALSDSGDRLVVGQRNHIGSEWAHIPDSAWVFSRQAGTWSAPVALVGTNLAAADEYGSAVAISPDGQRAVVSAVPAQMNADARVFVFRHDGAGWPLEQVLDGPSTNGLDGFGTAVAIGANVIMAGDPFYDDEWRENVGGVHVFDHNGTNWVRQPEVISSFLAHLGRSLALRGDALLIGCPGDQVAIANRMDGQWTLTGAIYSSDPQENSQFGWSVAIAGDRMDYVIGDPRATVEGILFEGRAHFVNAVSAPYDFDVEPARSTFTITLRFLGIPVTFEVAADGDLVGIVMDGCDAAGSFLLTESSMTNVSDPVITLPAILREPWGGAEVTISDLRVTIAEVGKAAALDDQGMGTLTGYRFQVTGRHSAAGGLGTTWVYITDPLTLNVQLTGGYGEPFDLRMTDVGLLDVPLDVGLGALNPTLTVEGNIAAGSTPDTPIRLTDYGMGGWGFRLVVTGAPGLPIVVETCSDLCARDWIPVASGVLTNDLLEVIDRAWTNHPVRFYRARSP
jgi:hypothetical protein